MQRLIIPDLWIPLSGLLWSWYRIHCRRSLYFCAWMIRWYLNLAQNLKMFQNCLTMPHTTVPIIWMDTALWVSCSAYLLYHRSFFMIPKVPSAWMDLFILRSAHWILSRFSITSWCITVSSRLIWTVRFLSVFLHCSAYGQPEQSSHWYTSSWRPYLFPFTFFRYWR